MSEDEATAEPAAETAHENLRVIRELMERATIYRAISAAPALVGAFLTLIAAAVLISRPDLVGATGFVVIWLVVYLIVDCHQSWLIIRESKRSGEEFPSARMLHGAFAIAPAVFTGGCVGLVLALAHEELSRCVLIWAMGYGLGLLATSSFSPASIRNLGWAFLLSGLGLFFWHELSGAGLPGNPIVRGALLMGLTFGLIHLIYGIWIGLILRRRES